MATRVKVTKAKQADDVREVFATTDPEEANRRLAAGWTLLHGAACHVDNFGYNVKPTFILGRTR